MKTYVKLLLAVSISALSLSSLALAEESESCTDIFHAGNSPAYVHASLASVTSQETIGLDREIFGDLVIKSNVLSDAWAKEGTRARTSTIIEAVEERTAKKFADVDVSSIAIKYSVSVQKAEEILKTLQRMNKNQKEADAILERIYAPFAQMINEFQIEARRAAAASVVWLGEKKKEDPLDNYYAPALGTGGTGLIAFLLHSPDALLIGGGLTAVVTTAKWLYQPKEKKAYFKQKAIKDQKLYEVKSKIEIEHYSLFDQTDAASFEEAWELWRQTVSQHYSGKLSQDEFEQSIIDRINLTMKMIAKMGELQFPNGIRFQDAQMRDYKFTSEDIAGIRAGMARQRQLLQIIKEELDRILITAGEALDKAQIYKDEAKALEGVETDDPVQEMENLQNAMKYGQTARQLDIKFSAAVQAVRIIEAQVIPLILVYGQFETACIQNTREAWHELSTKIQAARRAAGPVLPEALQRTLE